jgi:hypothetical protein
MQEATGPQAMKTCEVGPRDGRKRGRVQDSRGEALVISIPKSETAVMFVPEFE